MNYSWKWLPADFTLPTIYDDTMTYEKQLRNLCCKFADLAKYVDDICSRMDGYKEEIANMVNAQLSQFKSEMDTEFELLRHDILMEIQTNRKEIEKQWEYIGERFSELTTAYNNLLDEFNKFTATVNGLFMDFQTKMETEYDNFKKETNEKIYQSEIRQQQYTNKSVDGESSIRRSEDVRLENLIDKITMENAATAYCPWRGRVAKMSQIFLDLWQLTRPFGLTSSALYDTGVTWDQLSDDSMSFFEVETFNAFWEEFPKNK